MPFDAMFLTAVAAELRPTLVGARVDKVQQPARDTVVLQLRGRDGGGRLLLSANGNRPRVHLTQAQLENPAQPPMFCMLLRKHLAGGRAANSAVRNAASRAASSVGMGASVSPAKRNDSSRAMSGDRPAKWASSHLSSRMAASGRSSRASSSASVVSCGMRRSCRGGSW